MGLQVGGRLKMFRSAWSESITTSGSATSSRKDSKFRSGRWDQDARVHRRTEKSFLYSRSAWRAAEYPSWACLYKKI
ncbi:hypothetical protein AYI68_g6475 [Smittium mucronatum]|uniref:Uncharacterized protein n=1 Tax=Smittium mucronatum TaxID=133383 RepID=A0A1R0GRI9_9FUNG|nr:hypothetical protein AYI68_g6475 [Smittium mucronatum]